MQDGAVTLTHTAATRLTHNNSRQK